MRYLFDYIAIKICIFIYHQPIMRYFTTFKSHIKYLFIFIHLLS